MPVLNGSLEVVGPGRATIPAYPFPVARVSACAVATPDGAAGMMLRRLEAEQSARWAVEGALRRDPALACTDRS